MEAALTAYLLAQNNLMTLIGNRLTWGRREQGKPLPAIVLHRIDGVPDYHATAASGLVESRIQADCWSSSLSEAQAVSRALEAVVSGKRFVQGTVRFDAILIADQRQDTFDETGGALYRVSLDLSVHHARAA